MSLKKQVSNRVKQITQKNSIVRNGKGITNLGIIYEPIKRKKK